MRNKNIFCMALLFSILVILSACSSKDENVKSVESCESGKDIAFVFESTTSMTENDAENLRIKETKEIVEEMTENDRALVISFHHEAEALTELTSNKEDINFALDHMPSGEYRNLGTALDLANNRLTENESSNQKVMIALISGENSIGNSDELTKINQDTYNQSLIASNNNIMIYTIGLGENVDSAVLGNIANHTGGKYYHAEDHTRLEEIYRRIAEDIKCLPVEEANQSNSKYVIFDDVKLKQLINKALGFEVDHNLTEEDLAKLTEISFDEIEKNEIVSLKGLEYATNLKSITSNNKEIAGLSSIVTLTNLEQLYANYKNEKQNTARKETENKKADTVNKEVKNNNVVKGGLSPDAGRILTYHPTFLSDEIERGTYEVRKEYGLTVLLSQDMVSSYAYSENKEGISMGVYETDWTLLHFNYPMIEGQKLEEHSISNIYVDEAGFPLTEIIYGDVISTTSTVTVKAGTFKGVTIVKTAYGTKLYFAPGYGVIKAEDNLGNVTVELVEVR